MRGKRVVSSELSELGARAQVWRERFGGRGSVVPESLWQEAVKLARSEGLGATARITRFSYERLKARCEGAKGDVAEKRVNGSRSPKRGASVEGGVKAVASKADSRFVALQMPSSRTGNGTTVELVGRRGERMRVEITGEVDLLGLVQAFWRRTP